ncbi:MAG: DUF1732 domain-containing protein, partial [Bacteroidota bacterium]
MIQQLNSNGSFTILLGITYLWLFLISGKAKISYMLLSMTGYGRASRSQGDKTISVELRSLNSKYTDLRLRAPQNLRERELELRRLVTDFAQRGKLEMTVEIMSTEGDEDLQVNHGLLNRLYTEILAGSNGKLTDQNAGELYNSLLRIPNVIIAGSDEMPEEQWKSLLATTKECLENFNFYRRQEGTVMADDLRSHAQAIKKLLGEVPPHEELRIQAVRERMERHLVEYMGRANVDKNRYEQEVLFYLEKIDINEEKVRLAQNCDYFLEILDNKKETKGRKLAFIGQEIGREINTLGAKA